MLHTLKEGGIAVNLETVFNEKLFYYIRILEKPSTREVLRDKAL